MPSTRKISASGGTSTMIDLAGEGRQRVDAEHAVEQGRDVGDENGERHAPDAGIGTGMVVEVANRDPSHRHGRDQRHEQRNHARPKLAGFDRQRRHRLRPKQCHQHHVAEIEAGQHQARHDRAVIHVADRAAELVGEHDQHQRRRDDLRQRARGGDDAGGDAPVVAVAQHDRQRDQAHGDDRGGDDAGRRGQQRADQDDRIGEAAAHRAEQLPDRVEQVLGHAGSLEDQPHEGEERNRQQRLVRHHPPEPVGQRVKQRPGEVDLAVRVRRQLHADDEEQQAVGGKREGDGIAEQQEHHQAGEHDRRQIAGDELNHRASRRRGRE